MRPAGLFGEGDPQMTPSLLTLYYTKKTGFQLGPNNNLFDFTYVGNVAHAHILAALALLTTYNSSTAPLDHEKVDGEAFMITNDTPIYFWDLPRMFWREAGSDLGTEHVWTISKEIGLPLAGIVEGICKIIGVPTKFTRKGFKFSCMTRYYDITKAKTRLRYTPLWTLQEGVRLATIWDAEQRKMAAEKKGQ
jgi:sterol-4alpha-carboxylate 3-dehydrogenase (decarboxylating)